MSRRVLVTLLGLLCGCMAEQHAIERDEQSYRSDTLLLNRIFVPLGVEEPHGQVTVVVGSKFTEKLIRASLQPNTLSLSILKPGVVWSQDAGLTNKPAPRKWEDALRKPFEFANEVRLVSGNLDVVFGVADLQLHGDLMALAGQVSGHGSVKASVRFYDVVLQREIELWVHDVQPLQVHLERGQKGCVLRLVGEPLKVVVDFALRAVEVADHDLAHLKFSHTITYPLDKLAPWELPQLAPQVVTVGGLPLSLGLNNFQIGTREGALWVGADVVVAEPGQARK